MRIGIDIMGGDFAPEAVLGGVIKALPHLEKTTKLFLFGDSNVIEKYFKNKSIDINTFEVVHCTETIEMAENPAKSFKQKRDSSIVTGFTYLKNYHIDSFASAGNTGAMMIGAMQVIKSIPGIIRPAIATSFPQLNGKANLILDVGINPDCRPDILYQYGIIGSIFSELIYKIKNPRVALLNLGAEEGKGNLLTKATYDLMKDSNDFNFIGNIEGNDLYDDKADVVICEGFVGNIILKKAESFYKIIKSRNINDEFLKKFNFEIYGGTPVLGINSTVIIAHGISNETAIKNMILQTQEVLKVKLTEKIKEAFNNE